MQDHRDLSDAQWALLEPLLPDRAPRRGGRWSDHRHVVDGVSWRTRTGAPWRDLPPMHGHWQTVYERHRRWSGGGTWRRVLDGLRAGPDTDLVATVGEWVLSTDSTTVRAHQDAAGARTDPPADIDPAGWRSRSRPPRPGAGHRGVDTITATSDPTTVRREADRERERLGRSRGGLSTKIHLLADARCRPVAAVTSPGQRGDTLACAPLMAALRTAWRGPGRPRTRPDRLLADKMRSSAPLRSELRRRGIKTTIPVPDDQAGHRVRWGSRGGRPPAFDPGAYRARNTVERAFDELKTYRAFATRADRRAYVHTGTTTVAAIRIWLRDLTRQDPRDTPQVDSPSGGSWTGRGSSRTPWPFWGLQPSRGPSGSMRTII